MMPKVKASFGTDILHGIAEIPLSPQECTIAQGSGHQTLEIFVDCCDLHTPGFLTVFLTVLTDIIEICFHDISVLSFQLTIEWE